MAFIQPLELQEWIINVFSGNPDIFIALAFITIAGFAAFFKMGTLSMFFMLGMFALLFSAYISSLWVTLFAIVGGLLIGYWLSRFVK